MNEANKSLAKAIERITQTDGAHTTAIPNLLLFRKSNPSEPIPCMYGTGLIAIAQGSKRVMWGETIYNYDVGQTLLVNVDTPAVSHITHATAAEPYLGLMLMLEPQLIAQKAADLPQRKPSKSQAYQAMTVQSLNEGLHNALIRLVLLLDEPELIAHLAPLIEQEIVVRLLSGTHGENLWHFMNQDSPSQRIVQSIAWLKQNFMHPMRVDELAANAHMSPSTFREHFRSVTGVSPLQYQKQLRLQGARQLMLSQQLDAGSAAIRVGYESVSQFNREYSRLFGAPPLRDVRQMQANT